MRPLQAMLVLILASLIMLGGAAAAKPPKTLFADDAVIDITLDSKFYTLARRAKKSTEPFAAKLMYDGETHDITLAARGKTRRVVHCKFPPLRVRFSKEKGAKPAKESLFRGQKSLKLVTHCNSDRRNTQYVLLEYAAYKIYSLLTEAHLKVRLARIQYQDGRRQMSQRYGFFIEDTDDAAKRLGMKELDIALRVNPGQLSQDDAARVILFQYMIGNLDYSIILGPKGSDCCHNVKLIGAKKTSTESFIPVPYDYDSTGFVNAHYAVPPANVNVKSVTVRRYRGLCRFNDSVMEQSDEFQARKAEILQVLDTVPDLEEGRKRKAIRYLEGFFAATASADATRENLLSKCR